MVVFLRSPFKCFSIDFHMARRLFQASGTFETITSKKMVLVGMETEKRKMFLRSLLSHFYVILPY